MTLESLQRSPVLFKPGWLTLIASVLVACIATARATAQGTIDSTRIVLDNWTFVPIDVPSASGVRVHSFLALKNKAVAVGGNIASVWFIRPTQQSGAWTAKAWQSINQWDAIKTVSQEMGLSTDESQWPTTDPKTLGAPADVGTAYEKGFLVGDLNGAALADNPVRDWIIDAMVGSGYTVADISFDKAPPGAPAPDYWLSAIAQAVDSEKAVGQGPGSGVSLFLVTTAAVPCEYKPRVTWSGRWQLLGCGPWTCHSPSGNKVGTSVYECSYVKSHTCVWRRKITYVTSCGYEVGVEQEMTRTDSVLYICRYTAAQLVENQDNFPAGNGCADWVRTPDGANCSPPCGSAPANATPGNWDVTPPLPPGMTDPDGHPPVVIS